MSDWYSVRSVIVQPRIVADWCRVYEERIVMLRADNEEDALARAEVEASQYANNVGGELLPFSQSYHLFDDPHRDSEIVEVYSLTRNSELVPDDFINRFFDSGNENQRQDPVDRR